MNQQLFDVLAWVLLILTIVLFVVTIVFLFMKKFKESLKAFGVTVISGLVFISMFAFFYPDEYYQQDTDYEVEAESVDEPAEVFSVELIEASFNKESNTTTVKITTDLPTATDVELTVESVVTNAADEEVVLLQRYPAKVNDGKIIVENATIPEESGMPEQNENYLLHIKIPVKEGFNENWKDKNYEDEYGNLTFFSTGEGEGEYALYNDVVMQIGAGYSGEEITQKADSDRKAALQEKKVSAKEIRFAELNKNPDKYYDKFVQYTGEILQIMEDSSSTVMRLAVTKETYGYSYDDVVYVTYDGTTEFVDEDIVTVYGLIKGSHTYESQAGYQISLPLLEAELVE
ncbi:flagellar basal body-associated protein FliL [Planomicrobium stackebrandtii]|uniref:Flagellar basal body-associated protein FliL n=1 Tax=Planomicrobium stackebrandtii TaxID=253160 RepID=A0ABU0GW58_9BACL|nr:hypothetical protein [Planomicrobium stackebrandtii]MDQ0428797.1 flagellar basal body-associated protein FliL [Planomicrobium stackebrandtii]